MSKVGFYCLDGEMKLLSDLPIGPAGLGELGDGSLLRAEFVGFASPGAPTGPTPLGSRASGVPTGPAGLSDVQRFGEQHPRAGHLAAEFESLSEVRLGECPVAGALGESGLPGSDDDLRPPAGKGHRTLRDPVDDVPRVTVPAAREMDDDRFGGPRHTRWVHLSGAVRLLLELSEQRARSLDITLAVRKDTAHVQFQAIGERQTVVITSVVFGR